MFFPSSSNPVFHFLSRNHPLLDCEIPFLSLEVMDFEWFWWLLIYQVSYLIKLYTSDVGQSPLHPRAACPPCQNRSRTMSLIFLSSLPVPISSPKILEIKLRTLCMWVKNSTTELQSLSFSFTEFFSFFFTQCLTKFTNWTISPVPPSFHLIVYSRFLSYSKTMSQWEIQYQRRPELFTTESHLYLLLIVATNLDLCPYSPWAI